MAEPSTSAGSRAGTARLLATSMRVAQAPVTRVSVAVAAVALAVWALAVEREGVADAATRLSPWAIAAAFALTVGSTAAAGLLWRDVLADLGSRLRLAPAARIFFIGQLGKYLPGSVWTVVMQAELGAAEGLPRRRTATASVVFMLVALVSAVLVVLGCLPFADVVPEGFGWTVLLVVPLLVALHPRVLVPGINRLLRVLGREPLEHATSLAGTARATAWAVVSWLGAGLQVVVLAWSLGAPRTLDVVLLGIGGYTLAWAVGFVVVIAPAGAGPREVALIAVLSPVLERAELLVLVLASRVLFTLADLTTAGAAVLAARRRPR